MILMILTKRYCPNCNKGGGGKLILSIYFYGRVCAALELVCENLHRHWTVWIAFGHGTGIVKPGPQTLSP